MLLGVNKMLRRAIFLSVLTALLGFGCEASPRTAEPRDGSTSDTDGGGFVGLDGGPRADVPFIPIPEDESCRQMDILFVIDDSGSMQEEQTNLIANFNRFIEVLDAYEISTGESLDYRIGVTTTGTDVDVTINFSGPGTPPMTMSFSESGPSGRLLQPSECGMARPWIESTDPNVTDTFACLARVGTSGSGIEMPLYMTELALTQRTVLTEEGESSPPNAGFLREDALLSIVILTDEDDCSTSREQIELNLTFDAAGNPSGGDPCDRSSPDLFPISRFLTQLDAVKQRRGRWAAAIIAGPNAEMSCMSAFGEAAGAIRLHEFLSQVGDNQSYSSICDGDLAGGLMNALDTFTQACDSFPPLI